MAGVLTPGSGNDFRYKGVTDSGPPTAGSYTAGDWVEDGAGGIQVCTIAGTPGTWAGLTATSEPILGWIHAFLYATGGTGTLADPWTGWETGLLAAIGDNATVFFQGYFSTSSVLDFSGSANVRLLGPVPVWGTTAGITTPSELLYTGSSTHFVNATISKNFTVENLRVRYNNASFTGILVDVTGTDYSTNCTLAPQFRNSHLTGTSGTATGALLVSLNFSIEADFFRTRFDYMSSGIRGYADANSSVVPTAVSIRRCRFGNHSTGYAIINPGKNWVIDDATVFEPRTDGHGAAIGFSTSSGTCENLTIDGVGFWADALVASSWIDIQAAIKNLSIVHCRIELASVGTFLKVLRPITGCELANNRVTGATGATWLNPGSDTIDGLIDENNTFDSGITTTYSRTNVYAGPIYAAPYADLHPSATSAYTIGSRREIHPCDATSAAFAVTLPAASTYQGRKLTIKKTDSSGNAVTVARAGSDTIDGATTYALSAQWKYVTLVSDGSASWFVIANN